MTDPDRPAYLDTSRPQHCKAVRDQTEVYDWEDDLVAAARIRHRTCAWWWGARMTPVAFGAFCYVCDSLIVTWARNFPITKRAQSLVETHKFFHRAELIRARTHPTE